MPISKIKPSGRATALIAGVVAASVGGYTTIFGGYTVPDDVALAVKIIQPWEGLSLKAYHDTLAKPPVWTICHGDTDDVKPGQVETPEGCDKRLAVKLVRDYRAPLVKCTGDWDKRPLSWRAAMLSLSWNIGTGGACGSNAMRLAKEGKYRESCEAATAWNKAGGGVLKGLVLRREMGDEKRIGEAELCVSGL